MKPDSGTAIIMDHNILSESLKAKQTIGVVPEMANAYIDLTAWQNIMFIGELYGVTKKVRQERAEHLLKEFDLYERRNHLTKGFSKGMKQKLILCMALLTEPQILFLDEPTSGLDVESARRSRDLVRQYTRARGGPVQIEAEPS